MDENVVIKISGLQIVENTGDNVEVIAKGKHYLKKDKHYLLYEEYENHIYENIGSRCIDKRKGKRGR